MVHAMMIVFPSDCNCKDNESTSNLFFKNTVIDLWISDCIRYIFDEFWNILTTYVNNLYPGGLIQEKET